MIFLYKMEPNINTIGNTKIQFADGNDIFENYVLCFFETITNKLSDCRVVIPYFNTSIGMFEEIYNITKYLVDGKISSVTLNSELHLAMNYFSSIFNINHLKNLENNSYVYDENSILSSLLCDEHIEQIKLWYVHHSVKNNDIMCAMRSEKKLFSVLDFFVEKHNAEMRTFMSSLMDNEHSKQLMSTFCISVNVDKFIYLHNKIKCQITNSFASQIFVNCNEKIEPLLKYICECDCEFDENTIIHEFSRYVNFELDGSDGFEGLKYKNNSVGEQIKRSTEILIRTHKKFDIIHLWNTSHMNSVKMIPIIDIVTPFVEISQRDIIVVKNNFTREEQCIIFEIYIKKGKYHDIDFYKLVLSLIEERCIGKLYAIANQKTVINLLQLLMNRQQPHYDKSFELEQCHKFSAINDFYVVNRIYQLILPK